MIIKSTPCRLARSALVALLPIALLTGCATPEARLRTGLVKAGLSQPMASCMAESMADRLSIGQLRKLSSLADTGKLDPRNTSYNELVRHIRALGDPEILRVSATAAISCSLR